ncbi:YwqG family protein [Flavobacteriaceae bacterium MHTCC 0001]
MGIFNFFRKKTKLASFKEETQSKDENQKKNQKPIREVVDFFNTQSFEELIRIACENADMSNYYDDVFKLVKPSILMLSEQDDSIDQIIGASKVGGIPDVPKGFDWPKREQLYLSFLLQINCKDLPVNSFKELPKKGLISVFFGFDNDLASTSPDNTGFGQMYYFDEEELNRIQCPNQVQVFSPCKVSYINYPSLPHLYDDNSRELWNLDFLKKEEDLDDGYSNIEWNLEKLSGLSGVSYHKPRHQLFGYSQSVQSENIEVIIAKSRLDIDKKFKDFSKNELEKVLNQKLVLQVNEDSNAGIQLIDSGKIYYVGEKKNENLNDDLWTFVDFG